MCDALLLTLCSRSTNHRSIFFSYLSFFRLASSTQSYTFPYTTLFRSLAGQGVQALHAHRHTSGADVPDLLGGDRKSTRLNSSHVAISYAVFCLKKKKDFTDQHFVFEEIYGEFVEL